MATMQRLNVRRRLAALLIGWLWWLAVAGQPVCHVVRYNEADGVSSSHLTQLLQDDQGFLWFATWNGLCRYDGYEFRTFKPQVGDGCQMKTDRIRNMALLPTRQILCQVDDDYYMFDLARYRFRDLTAAEQATAQRQMGQYRQSRSLQRKPFTWTDRQQTRWTLTGDGLLSYRDSQTGADVPYALPMAFRTLTFAMPDDQGNLWALDYGNVYKFCTSRSHTSRINITPRAEVKCLFADRQGRLWVATKDDEAVRVYRAADGTLLGYLGADGRLHDQYTRFGAAVYCMYEQHDGTLWLGTKPKGLFRLLPTGAETFKIAHFIDIPNPAVYHIAEDREGRLWVATLGGGIFYTAHPLDDAPRFYVPRHYPQEAGRRARYLLFTDDGVLLVATGSGLLAAQWQHHADDMHFHQHQREPNRRQSLSCSAVMDVVCDRRGRYFVSTESGGVNQIVSDNLLDSVLCFRHLRDLTHDQPNDIIQSLTLMPDGQLLAVGSHLLTVVDTTGQGRVLDASYFGADYRFSEAHPVMLPGDRWLFGLTDGAFQLTARQLSHHNRPPRIVLTGVSIQGAADRWGVAYADTLVLQPDERSLTVRFAALDYCLPSPVSYAFRLLPNAQWNYVGHDRSATLLDLEPGTYQLELRSTNGDGEWADNVRRLTIVVTPTFWESAWGRLLIACLVVAVIAAVAYTILYIRRMKRKQHETLEAYLSLVAENNLRQLAQPEPRVATDDPMLERVMAYVEQNIANSEANVGDMASAAATSRSGLQRKLRTAMGITPQDLLREARIKHACQLLQHTDKTVAEVAYACGFTDPKYFSRTFKQSTGRSPSEYKRM